MVVEGCVLVVDSELEDVIEDNGGEEGEGNGGCSQGEEKDNDVMTEEEGEESESTAEKHLPEDPRLLPEKCVDHQRDTIVCRLANKLAERTDMTKMAPKDGRQWKANHSQMIFSILSQLMCVEEFQSKKK